MTPGSTAADEPGPPPLPPADLDSRLPSKFWLSEGTELLRIHSTARDPLFFGPAAGSPPRGRWDAPAGEFGVCYLAEESHIAFAESFLRAPGESLIEEADLAPRSISRIRVRRDLRLVGFHGAGLTRIGATAAVATGPYAVSRAWALAIHAHPTGPDGIRYRARHDDDGFAIALFDRTADALEVEGTDGLTSPACRRSLAEWLDRYGMGLV